MSYTLSNSLPANPATGSLNGQKVYAWLGSRFSPVNTPPATNGAAPSGSADYGPYTTNSISDGFWTFAVTSILPTDEFIIQTWDPADTSNGGTYNTYWRGPYLINPSTNQVGWTLSSDQSANRYILKAQFSGSSITLPQATIPVFSTAGFPTAGTLMFISSTPPQIITYTGTTGTSFTGCAGGTATVISNQAFVPTYQNGNYRRLVLATAACTVWASGDVAEVGVYSTIGGSVIPVSAFGIGAFTLSGGRILVYASPTFIVDPLGYYCVYPTIAGTGTVGAPASWIETDH